MTSAPRYHISQIALHWGMALLILSTFAFGLYVADLPLSPAKFSLIAWHKWLGITVLGLWLIRFCLRLIHRAPALPDSMSKPAQLAAHGGHLALYALMLAVPLTGWTMSSAYGFPVVFLKVLPLPDLVAVNETLGDQLKALHEALNWTLLAVIGGHLLAALKHHFLDRDGLMQRMAFKNMPSKGH